MRSTLVVILGSCLLIASSSFFVYAADLKVTRVKDGGSLVLNDGREVRLIGIDCPEFKDFQRNQRNADRLGIPIKHYSKYAQKSKDYLKELVSGRVVRTEIDPINAITGHHDKYRRFLAYVYADDLFVNSALVNQGYCVTYERFDFRFKDEFLKHQQDAKENERGMWR